jgi:hypothetical protein
MNRKPILQDTFETQRKPDQSQTIESQKFSEIIPFPCVCVLVMKFLMTIAEVAALQRWGLLFKGLQKSARC